MYSTQFTYEEHSHCDHIHIFQLLGINTSHRHGNGYVVDDSSPCEIPQPYVCTVRISTLRYCGTEGSECDMWYMCIELQSYSVTQSANTVQVRYCAGTILCRYDTVQAQYCAGTILCRCDTVQVRYCAGVILCRYDTVQVRYCAGAILCRCDTVQVRYCAGTILCGCDTVQV